MPLYDFFKDLFNIPSVNPNKESSNHETQDYNFWGPNADQNEEMWRDAHTGQDDGNMRNFNVFTDPLEMHRYFEQQMNEILKSFGGFFGGSNPEAGFFGPDNGGGTFGFSHTHPPAIDEWSQHPDSQSNGSLRDRFLKPEYENRSDNTRRDHVLDDRTINPGDLDELLKEKQSQTQSQSQHEDGMIAPYQQQPLLPKIRSFGQSMSSKTVRRPDGSLEIHKTIRDSAGNEENVVTRQIGDKQYTITVRTDKQGRQEKCEDLVNMDEKDLPKFKDYWSRGSTPSTSSQNQNQNQNPDDSNINRLFPYFDKFFK